MTAMIDITNAQKSFVMHLQGGIELPVVRGVSFHVHWTLTDVSSPKGAEWQGHGPAHSAARIRYELSGDGDGPTRFAYTNEFTTPGGRLGDIASRFIVGATSQREANNSLARLKALLERG